MSGNDKNPTVSAVTRREILKSTVATGIAAALGAGVTLSARPARSAGEPDKPSQLIVRAWGGSWSKALEDTVSKPFTEMTGIKVVHDNTFHTEMKTKIWQAQAQKRELPCHVTWDTTANAVTSARHGSAVDLSDLSNIPQMRDIAVPSGAGGIPYINMYIYVYCMGYAPSKFPAGAPDSWAAFLDPKFKGRVGLFSSGNGTIHIAQIAAGGKLSDYPDNMEAGWKWIEAVRAQNPVLGKDEDITRWVQQREIDVSMNAIADMIDFKRAGGDIAWTVPKEGAYATTDCLWVPKGLPENEEYWAKQYINLSMKDEVSQKWCDLLGNPSLNKKFVAPKDFANDPAYPSKEEDFKRLVILPMDVEVDNWDKWVLRFKSIMNV
ncbi:extracellular solute-binding protein [Mesorhizobium sp. CO1-1-11]|uniref:ABC transporter substrate-binding protein n=1 Tax=Mesorhizobium sp. CO1-1-11 TaxID=2876636 RepID=UPI001CCA32A5|nr:extracellular solute-binding protein [Mesorhizobium sp. CO1-1-11]MBZ9726318.1 extracellular solute-binding protein [Mesorhizobium sp. CO1-1-11]